MNKESEEKMNKNKRWKPARGKIYYYVTSGGTISRGIADKCSVFQFHYAQCNCFATEGEAEKHLDNLKTKGELRLLAEELNGNKIIDWKDGAQLKVAIIYFARTQQLGVTTAVYAQDIGQIYCLSENFLVEAIKRIGKKRLIGIIKSGV